MLKPKTALGIDISDGKINLALLKQGRDGISLVKTAVGAVGDKAVQNGNIEDPVLLAKAIKKLKAKNRIGAHRTAVSLVANPVLMQVLELPRAAAGSIGRFVRNEVKNYAILPIENTAVDFCGIKSSISSANRRVFVVAADRRPITDAVQAMLRTRLNIDAIEPALAAYVRACYEKKIARKFDRNLLFAIIRHDVLTFFLFRNQTLDFVRTKRLDPDILHSDRCCQWLVEEINAVIQFYELEAPDICQNWEVTVLTNISSLCLKEKAESLQADVRHAELKIVSLEDAYLDTPVADTALADKPSAVAVGLAMKLLNSSGSSVNINLLGPDVTEGKYTTKQALITANVAAAVFILMTICAALFNIKTKQVNQNLRRKVPVHLVQNTSTLVDEQVRLDQKIQDLSEKLSSIDALIVEGPVLKWAPVLGEIARAAPGNVRITNASCDDNSNMLLQGQALSYEDIYLFVDMLNDCKHVESALLTGARNSGTSNALVHYSVNCSLTE